MEVTYLLDIHTREELYAWYLENHATAKDFWLRVNRAVAPDLDPKLFVFEKWVLDAIKADKPAWKFFKSCPENYRRIKVDRIQHYQNTGRSDYAQQALQKFIRDVHNGKLQPGWSDFGRLEDCNSQ